MFARLTPSQRPGHVAVLLALLAGGSALVGGCAATQAPPIMSWERYRQLSVRGPYIVNISRVSGTLLYFGVEHSVDPAHPQFVTMQELWQRVRPTLVLAEGWGRGARELVVQSPDEAILRAGESGLIRLLAERDRIPVRTLEPAAPDEARELLQHFSVEQVKVFYVLRQVAQHRRDRMAVSLDEYIQRFLRELSQVAGLEGAPRSLSELDRSTSRLFGARLTDWRDVPDSWLRPTLQFTFTNEIQRRVVEIRDQHMVRLLAKEVKHNERVFAIVGFSHVVMQEPALRALLR